MRRVPAVYCRDCHAITSPGPRCADCQRAYERRRNARPARQAYRLPAFRAASRASRGAVCWICGQPGSDTLDHMVPLAVDPSGGGPDNWRPAHRRCNASATRKAQAQQRQGEPAAAEQADRKPIWWVIG